MLCHKSINYSIRFRIGDKVSIISNNKFEYNIDIHNKIDMDIAEYMYELYKSNYPEKYHFLQNIQNESKVSIIIRSKNEERWILKLYLQLKSKILKIMVF